MFEFIIKFQNFIENSNYTEREKDVINMVLNDFIEEQQEIEEKIFYDNNE